MKCNNRFSPFNFRKKMVEVYKNKNTYEVDHLSTMSEESLIRLLDKTIARSLSGDKSVKDTIQDITIDCSPSISSVVNTRTHSCGDPKMPPTDSNILKSSNGTFGTCFLAKLQDGSICLFSCGHFFYGILDAEVSNSSNTDPKRRKIDKVLGDYILNFENTSGAILLQDRFPLERGHPMALASFVGEFDGYGFISLNGESRIFNRTICKDPFPSASSYHDVVAGNSDLQSSLGGLRANTSNTEESINSEHSEDIFMILLKHENVERKLTALGLKTILITPEESATHLQSTIFKRRSRLQNLFKTSSPYLVALIGNTEAKNIYDSSSPKKSS